MSIAFVALIAQTLCSESMASLARWKGCLRKGVAGPYNKKSARGCRLALCLGAFPLVFILSFASAFPLLVIPFSATIAFF
jgi:hypothetical protein